MKKASGVWNSHAVGPECSLVMTVFPFRAKMDQALKPRVRPDTLSSVSDIYSTFSVRGISVNL